MPSFLLNYLIRQVVYFSLLNLYISSRAVSQTSLAVLSVLAISEFKKVADLRFFRCSLGSRVLQSRICRFPVSTRRQTPTRTPTSLDASKVSFCMISFDVGWSKPPSNKESVHALIISQLYIKMIQALYLYEVNTLILHQTAIQVFDKGKTKRVFDSKSPNRVEKRMTSASWILRGSALLA